MAAQHQALDVLHRDIQGFGDERPVARRIQHARHADHAVLGESAHPEGRLHHGVERVRHHNQNRIRRVLRRLLDGGLHHLVIRLQQIVAAHAGLAREARRHHHHVGIGGVLVIVRPLDLDVVAFNRARFQQVQTLALRDALQNVDQHHIRQLLVHNAVRKRRTHIPCPNHGYFFTHESSPKKD